MKHDAEAMGDALLKFLEDKPRAVAIETLARVLLTYLHPSDEEFFANELMRHGWRYYGEVRH